MLNIKYRYYIPYLVELTKTLPKGTVFNPSNITYTTFSTLGV